MSLVTAPAGAAVSERGTGGDEAFVPGVLYAIIASSAAILVGLIWDISWHRTIGRDTFWSPPHVLEQLAAVVAGASCGWLVLRTTFRGSEADRAASVRFWGFRGPLGAWVCIWGTLMMITSAPFDDWWHDAYGLDVRIISPPHMVLASGMLAIQVGAMLLAVAAQNRAGATQEGAGAARNSGAQIAGSGATRRLGLLYGVSAGILIGMAATVIMEDASLANEMHRSLFYKLTAITLPVLLLAGARASRLRWPATTAALVYMAVVLLMIWTLQLFPATPRLAPIYNPVTHMVPPPFPLLLVFPAMGLDLLLRRFGGMNDWLLAAAAGVLFVAVMFAVHWSWADFLLSPAARNFFFGADKWDYSVRLSPRLHEYWNPESGRTLFVGLAWAALFAAASARIGLWWGKGMSKVQR